MSCQLNNTHGNLWTDYQKIINRITVIWHEMHDFIMTFTLGLLLFSVLVNNCAIHFPIKTPDRVSRMFYFTTDLMQPVCEFYTPSTRRLIRGNGPMNQSSLLAMYLSSLLLVWLHKFILCYKVSSRQSIVNKIFFRHMTWEWLTPLKNQLTWRASFEGCVFYFAGTCTGM